MNGPLETSVINIPNISVFIRLINEVSEFCSPIFFIQFGTSGLCICGSVYSLAFVNRYPQQFPF